MDMKLQPIGDKIIIKPEETEDVSKGGIIIPDKAKERTQRGTVIAVGDGRTVASGEVLPLRINEGDYVVFAKYGGSEIMMDGETFILLAERDVHCRLIPKE